MPIVLPVVPVIIGQTIKGNAWVPLGIFCIGDCEMYSYTRYASRCLAILSINTRRLFTKGSVIPPEHRLMLVNFNRECISDAKKKPSVTEALQLDWLDCSPAVIGEKI